MKSLFKIIGLVFIGFGFDTVEMDAPIIVQLLSGFVILCVGYIFIEAGIKMDIDEQKVKK